MTVRRVALHTVKAMAAAADSVRSTPPGVVVLIFHRVGGQSGLEVDLPVDLFDAQCEHLVASATVLPLGDALAGLVSGAELPPHPVVITFDDGTADFAEHALPVLVRRRLPATIYVATDFLERGVPFPNEGRSMTWGALADAVTTGLVDVGSHTHRHRLLDRVDGATASEELDRSIQLIEDRLGVTPLDFAYPKGLAGSSEAADAVRARFRSAAVGGGRANEPGRTDPHHLFRTAVQVSDGMRWFRRKARGGLALEDVLRRKLNGRRYADAVS